MALLLGGISTESKMRNIDRIFKLERLPGEKPVNTGGMVDNRLFKEGEEANRLHCVMDLESSLWELKYDKGILPGPLQSRFTSFTKAKEHAEIYFLKRGIKITQIID